MGLQSAGRSTAVTIFLRFPTKGASVAWAFAGGENLTVIYKSEAGEK